VDMSDWPTGRRYPINDEDDHLGYAWVDPADALEKVGGTYVRARTWAEFHDNAGGPRLRLHLQVDDGRIEVRRSEFTTEAGTRGVRSQDFNWVRKNLTELKMFAVMAAPVYVRTDEGFRLIDDEQQALRDLRNVGTRTNRKWTPAALARLSTVFQECDDGEPVKAVQEEFGLRRDAANKAIRKARDEGFLPEPPPRGEVGR
jgi:hypothetical protein